MDVTHETRYEVVRVQGDVITPLSSGSDRKALVGLAKSMMLSPDRPEGVSYRVREIEIRTRPLTILADDVDDEGD